MRLVQIIFALAVSFPAQSATAQSMGMGMGVGVGMGSVTVAAQTPDGQTPANEGICDILQGGTPGLYGLCVAYCEAQDLDTVFDPRDPNSVKLMPNQKILANYHKRKAASDPGMPCIQPPPACPCWSEMQLDAAFISDGTPVICTVDEDGSTQGIPFVQLLEAGAGPNNVAQTFLLAGQAAPGCFFDDKTASPRINVLLGGIEEADFDVCTASIQAQAADVGGLCEEL